MSEPHNAVPYDGGYVRLVQHGIPAGRGGSRGQDAIIEIDNPQESLIEKIRIEIHQDFAHDGRLLEDSFCSYLVPHRFNVDELTKINHVLCSAGTSANDVDLETSIGLNHDGTLQETGVFFHSTGTENTREQMLEHVNDENRERPGICRGRAGGDC